MSRLKSCKAHLSLLTFLYLHLLVPTAEAATPIHGAKAAGMGTAFIAAGDDPSVIAANPAALTRSPSTQVYGGFTALTIDSRYISPAGEREGTDFQVFFPPNLFLSSDFGRQGLVFGLGFYAPYGVGGRKWSETGLTRYVSTESSISTFNVHPTVAWQTLPWLSLGGGFTYVYAFNRAERMIDQSLAGEPDGKMVLDADGDGWGYSFGLLVDLSERVSLGASYRSQTTVRFTGTTTLSGIAAPLQPLFGGAVFATRAETRMTFPDVISLGLALKPSDRLTLAIDGDLVRWSSLGRAAIRFRDEVPDAGFTDGLIVHDWRDTWHLKAGLDYRLSDALSLRTGYIWVDTPVPDHTLGPATPEGVYHNFCLGAGYRRGPYTLDAFYILGLIEDRKVENEVLSGTYQNRNHYLGVNLGRKF